MGLISEVEAGCGTETEEEGESPGLGTSAALQGGGWAGGGGSPCRVTRELRERWEDLKYEI